MFTPQSQSPHLKHGVKTGIAAVMAYSVANLFHLSYGYWAALSAVIVMQINVADSIRNVLVQIFRNSYRRSNRYHLHSNISPNSGDDAFISFRFISLLCIHDKI